MVGPRTGPTASRGEVADSSELGGALFDGAVAIFLRIRSVGLL